MKMIIKYIFAAILAEKTSGNRVPFAD